MRVEKRLCSFHTHTCLVIVSKTKTQYLVRLLDPPLREHSPCQETLSTIFGGALLAGECCRSPVVPIDGLAVVLFYAAERS